MNASADTETAANAPTDKTEQVAGQAGWLFQVAGQLRPFFWGIFLFSIAVNMLMLVAPMYMLQIYDRVISSGSRDTLIWLTVIAVFLLGIYAAAEAARRRISTMAGQRLEDKLAPKIFRRFETEPASSASLYNDLSSLQKVQGVFQGGALLPFFDLPFVPFFILVLFLIHPVLGVVGLIGAAVVLTIAVASELSTRNSTGFSEGAEKTASDFALGLHRQRSAMVAMGLVPRAFNRWRAIKGVARGFGTSASKKDNVFTSSARSARQILQVLILAAGAALVLANEMSPGSIIAGSIILSRALAPIDQIVGGWRMIVKARIAWSELRGRILDIAPEEAYTPLPRPAAALKLDRLAVIAPGGEAPLIRPFSYEVSGGEAIAVVGGNGVGKTTLLQTLAGAWPPGDGEVTLGGRAIHDWPSEDRGRFIGYLPQDVELLAGTVAENISRMGEASKEAVFDAAQRAGAHEMILGLPKGYDTKVGPGGTHLSAGQRQMVGLARALFEKPVLLLLDEPTANLDPAAAAALINALKQCAQGGSIVMTATHDLRLVRACETVLVLRNGAVMSAPSENYLAAFAKHVQNEQPREAGATA